MRVQNDSKVNLYLQQSATHCLVYGGDYSSVFTLVWTTLSDRRQRKSCRGSRTGNGLLHQEKKNYCSRRRISGKSTDSGKCAPQLWWAGHHDIEGAKEKALREIQKKEWLKGKWRCLSTTNCVKPTPMRNMGEREVGLRPTVEGQGKQHWEIRKKEWSKGKLRCLSTTNCVTPTPMRNMGGERLAWGQRLRGKGKGIERDTKEGMIEERGRKWLERKWRWSLSERNRLYCVRELIWHARKNEWWQVDWYWEFSNGLSNLMQKSNRHQTIQSGIATEDRCKNENHFSTGKYTGKKQ